jgi:hypothetical protein
MTRPAASSSVSSELAEKNRRGFLGQRVQSLQRSGRVLVVGRGRPDCDAALEALCEDDATRELCAKTSWNGEAVLRIERVIEGSAEGHCLGCV